jgi:hypothetical protein
MVLGAILMSSVYPLGLLVAYFRSLFMSARGRTFQEKNDHREKSFIAIAQFLLLIGLAMFVWGACDEYIKDDYLETRHVKEENFEYNRINPLGP